MKEINAKEVHNLENDFWMKQDVLQKIEAEIQNGMVKY